MKRMILTIILLFTVNTAVAENFILPKSFSLGEKDLPAIEKPKGKTPQIKKNIRTDIGLTNLIKSFNYSYSETLKSTLATLTRFNITPVDYDSSKGQIIAQLESGKQLFLLFVSVGDKKTYLRITPADGRYDISVEMVQDIFKKIERNLYSSIGE